MTAPDVNDNEIASSDEPVAVAVDDVDVSGGPIFSGIAGKCLDDNGGSTFIGTKIQIWTCNSSVAQRWSLPGDGTLVVVGKCLDVIAGGTAAGTKVQLWDCNGTGAQQWTRNPTTNAFVNPQSGRCLDDPGSSTVDGTQLQLWDCNGTAAQQWKLPS